MSQEHQAIQDKRDALEIARLERRGRAPRGLIGCLSVLIGAAGGVVLGAYLGITLGQLRTPLGPDSFGPIGSSGWFLGGALIGLFVGPLLCYSVSWAITSVWERWPERMSRRSG